MPTSLPIRRITLAALAALALAAPASAQEPAVTETAVEAPSSETEPLLLFPTDDLGLSGADPLGRAAPGESLDVRPTTDDELVTPPVAVHRGAVLDAISGVRESAHTIGVTLGHGLAIVEEVIELGSIARHRAEILEHLALPPGAALVSLEVCREASCREGVAAEEGAQGAYDDALVGWIERPSELPVAHARIEDGTLVVRAAPLVRGETLRLHFRWVAPAPMHGGVLFFELPARGRDDRIADVEITVTSDELVEPGLDGRPLDGERVTRRGGDALAISALAPRSGGTLLEAASLECATGRRGFARARSARPDPRPLRVAIAIDASPSTTAGARGRLADTALVLAELLPSGSEVLPLAFAARAEILGDGWARPEALEARRLRRAVDAELGSMTSLAALWDLVHAQPIAPDLVVVVGDGGVSSGEEAETAARAMAAAGVRLASVNVADRAHVEALRRALDAAGGRGLDVAPEAALASERDLTEALAARLLPIVSDDAASEIRVRTRGGTVSLGPLPAGEEISWSGAIPTAIADAARSVRPAALRAGDAEAICALLDGRRRLVAVAPADLGPSAGACAADGGHRARRPAAASGIFGAGVARIALAHRRSCEAPAAEAGPETAERRGYVPASLLRQLRRRVIPAARGCFRDDRAGRAHYSTRLVVHLVLADREIVHRTISDAATPELEACMREAIENLDLPSFDGTIVVRWPLHTEGEPIPPTLELAPDVSAAVDRIGAETASPLTPPSPSPED